MAGKTIDLNVRVKTALEGGDTLKSLRELKQVQKELIAGSEDYKKVAQRMADIKDKTKGATTQSQDLVDSLAAAPGPLGMLGRVIDTVSSSTNKFGLALKATGIGLVVALVGQLVTAFSSNEKAMKKLEPLMDGFQKILGGIFAALEPVFNLIVDLALKGMPYLIDAIGVLYAGFAGLGSFLKNFFIVQFKLFGAFGKVLKSVFTLDWDGVKEGVTDGVKAISDGISDVVNTTKDTFKRFQKGTEEMTDIEKKNAEEQAKLRKENAEKAAKAAADELTRRKGNLDAKIQLETDKENTSREKLTALYEQRYQAEIQGQKLTDAQKQVLRDANSKKIEEALKTDKDKRQKDFEEQVKQIQDAGKLQIEQLTSNLNQAKLLYGENSKEARAVQDEIFNAQSETLQKEKDLLTQKQELTEGEKTRLKSIAIEEQNLTVAKDLEAKKRIDIDIAAYLKTQDEAKKAYDAKYAANMAAAQGDFDQQQEILDAKVEQDKVYYDNLLAQENLTAEQRKAIQDAQTANVASNAKSQIEIEQKKFQAQQALLNATANAFSALADIVGKNTVAGKALAVAASIINTYTAIAGQLAAFSTIPVPGYAIVQAVATGLIGFKAVADIINTPIPSQGGGGGGGSTPSTANNGPSVPAPKGFARGGYISGSGTGNSDSIPALLSNGESVINAASTQMFKPLLSTINQIGGGRKFASGGMINGDYNQNQAMNDLSNSLSYSQQPIKTYVVANDISNQQMLDRAIKSRSYI